jgi:hypothetical protein
MRRKIQLGLAFPSARERVKPASAWGKGPKHVRRALLRKPGTMSTKWTGEEVGFGDLGRPLRFISPGVPPEDMHNLELQEKWMPNNPLYWERNPKLVEERGYVFDQACFYLYRSMFTRRRCDSVLLRARRQTGFR